MEFLEKNKLPENIDQDLRYFGKEDYLISFFVFIGIFIFENVFKFLTFRIFYLISKEQKDEELRKFRTLKAVNMCHKLIYYIFDSVFCFWTLGNTGLIPWYLGGSG